MYTVSYLIKGLVEDPLIKWGHSGHIKLLGGLILY